MRWVIVTVLSLSLAAAAEGDSGPISNRPALSRDVVIRVMTSTRPKIDACYTKYQVAGVAMVNLTIAPSGSVTAEIAPPVGSWGDFSNTSPTGLCIVDAVQSSHFPSFDGPSQKIAYPIVLGDSNAKPSDEAESTSEAMDNLKRSQQAYAAGKYMEAISLARHATSDDPQRAWRVIGASNCFLKDAQGATAAWKVLNVTGRKFVEYVCANNGVRIDEQ